MTEEKELIELRKKRILGLFKRNLSLVAILLVLIIALYSFSVRTINVPGLKDVTTGNYTLGPDLDPFLFLRWAKYIAEHGSLMKIDYLRYYPLGFDTSKETLVLPYLISYLYKIMHFLNNTVTVEFAAIMYPAYFFFLAVLAFFLFVRRLFVNETEIKRNLIALIATSFFIVMPSLVHRTVAGIPEKEAGGIFFLFLSLYFFMVSLQSKTKIGALIAGILLGISTGLLGMVWGAVTFIFLGIGLSMIVGFMFDITKEKDHIAYLAWIATSSILLGGFTTKYGGFLGLLTSTTSVAAYLTAGTMIFDFFFTRYLYKRFENKIKLPKRVVVIITTIILGAIFFIIINPDMVSHIIRDIRVGLLHPQGTDRIALTVAENNQPYFGSWKGTYGIEFFWLFIISAVIIFYEAVSKLKKIERYLLSTVYFLFLIGLVFSRYASNSVMNGTSSLSQFVYFGSFFLFAAAFAFVYITAFKNKEEKISHIRLESIVLLVLFFWTIVSARGAIRLFFLLDPFVAILAGFIIVYIPFKAFENKKNTLNMVLFAIAALIVLYLSVLTFYNFSISTTGQAQATVPSVYNIQWQYAMKWVRDNTPKDSVFVHWWDYGYWVQTIGERVTVVDGGNTIGYWDYLVGRHVLTGQNETEALEFLYAHNVSYLLIDSTDIGKYPAYSSIGSDLNYDRYNWVPTMKIDEKQTQETRNGTIYLYQGGFAFDEDFIWYDSSTKQQYLFPKQSSEAIIAGVLLTTTKTVAGEQTLSQIEQPKALIAYHGSTRIDIPLCYLYTENTLTNFKSNGPCLQAALYITPNLNPSGGGVNVNYMGAAMYLNTRALNALWVKLYLLNESQNFKLVHSEQSYVVQQLRKQAFNVPEFVYYGDIQGPIKIWKVEYPKGIKFKPEYLEISYPDPRLLSGGD